MNNRYFEINENGCNIRCKVYFNDIHDIRKAVIFVHGFGGHKDNKAAERFAERLLSKYKGYGVFTFNLPCHGDDVRKKLCLEDCLSYLDYVIQYVKATYPVEKLYDYATSFGGYLTLKYIHDHGNVFDKIVLRCPAINIHEALTQTIMKNEDMEKLKKGKEVAIGFDRKIMVTESFINELAENDIRKYDFLDYADDILVIQGSADEVVTPEDSKQFAEENVIEYVWIDGADHRFMNPKHMEYAIKAIMEFFLMK